MTTYKLWDGRTFGNQQDAETALGAASPVAWEEYIDTDDFTGIALGTVMRPTPEGEELKIGIDPPVQLLKGGTYEIRIMNGKLVEVSLVSNPLNQ